MAKQIKPKTTGINVDSEVSVVEEAMEAMVEQPKTDYPKVDEVSFNENLEQKSAVKFVKILPRADHNCVIGGTRYFLKKGVQQNVPAEVKEILMKSDLLMPL